MVVQIVLFFIVSGMTDTQHVILQLAFLIGSFKMSLDTFIINAMIFMDTYIYEDLKVFLFIVFCLGVLLCIGFIFDGFRKRKIKHEKADVRSLSKNHVMILIILTAITLFSFRDPLFVMLDSEGIIILFVSIIIYYALMAAVVLPIQELYCYAKFPSFHWSENEEVLAYLEESIKEIEQLENTAPLYLHVKKSDAAQGRTIENDDLYSTLEYVVEEFYDFGKPDNISMADVSVITDVKKNTHQAIFLLINRTEDEIRNISFEMIVNVDEHIVIYDSVPIQLSEDELGVLGVNHVVPILLDIESSMKDFIGDKAHVELKNVMYNF